MLALNQDAPTGEGKNPQAAAVPKGLPEGSQATVAWSPGSHTAMPAGEIPGCLGQAEEDDQGDTEGDGGFDLWVDQPKGSVCPPCDRVNPLHHHPAYK